MLLPLLLLRKRPRMQLLLELLHQALQQWPLLWQQQRLQLQGLVVTAVVLVAVLQEVVVVVLLLLML